MATLTSRTGDIKTRVEDYLDDRIQTTADLDTVNDLLAKVKEQQNLIRTQLAQAKSASSEADNTVTQHTNSLRERANSFQKRQADIDRRLRIITQSDSSDDAVKLFESRMTKLRRLEIAQGYAEILKEVDTLVEAGQRDMKVHKGNALASHARIRTLLHGLQAVQPAAEGAAPHLIDHVEQQALSLFTELKTDLESGLQTTLEKMAWPKKELKLTGNIVEDWRGQVESLLELQEPQFAPDLLDQSSIIITEPTQLLPLQVMVRPLALRFQYHFYGERPTNRLDKPEYFFSHALDLIDQHSPFMIQLLQPILDHRMRKSEQLETVYPDAVSAFITALLPMISAKCLSLLPKISSQPQLLSHFIHEMMSFDSTLRDSWAYAPVPGMYTDWKGLTWEMLNTHGYFNAWLEVEKEFALARYKKIRDSIESSNIEYDGIEDGCSKPTKGAVRVNDLLETVTDRYRGLSSFSQKMKFLMEIQLAIFDDYHNHLYGALQAYLVGSHTAGRLIQGQSEADALGLKGLETLTKIFGSAEYLERKMSDWSEDIFFLELWEELQDRAKRNTRGGSVGRDLHVDDVAAKTSATIKRTDETDDEGGALFDETATSYRKLRERSEVEVVRVLDINIRNALRPLMKLSVWSSLSSASSDISSLSISSALDGLLNTLNNLLEFLAKVMAPAPLRRITRQLCHTIQKEVYDNLILRHTFSAAGAAQLKRDTIAVEDVINSNVKMPGEAQRNMRKLGEALVLLNLSVKVSTRRAPKAVAELDEGDEDGWGFDEVNEVEDEAAGKPGLAGDNDDDDTPWGLWEAEKAIFANNEAARQALADMKLELLSESEARELIRRRVEINA